MGLFYSVATLTMKALLLSFSNWRVEGKGNVPKAGPLIIVANHLNLADPPLLSASIPRRIVFMAKEELFHSKGRAFVRAFGAFPVRRGELDREALRQALRVLEQGLALGMFPEGKRNPEAQMQPAELGTSLIALRSGAPILPVGISGSEKIKGISVVFHHPKITVNIGHPFSLPTVKSKPTKEQLSEVTEFIMEHVAELLPQSYRGVYGGRLNKGG